MGRGWTITQRSKHYSVTRMILRDRSQSVKFMLVVTEPPNVSTREIIKISRELTEVTALSYGARAPIELVLPTPRRLNKTLIVETGENGKEVDVFNAYDEVIVIAENQINEASSSSSRDKVDVIGKTETSNVRVDEVDPNQCGETSEVTSNVIPEVNNEEVPQECVSTADVKQMTKTPEQQ